MGKTGDSKTDSKRNNGSLRLDLGQSITNEARSSRPRIALYSHDTMGLGHLRRNLLIAQSLVESDFEATALLVTGVHETNFFSLPTGIDCLTLPRLQKDRNGNYFSEQLGISVNELVNLRAESICSAMKAFQPDLFLVDKVPTGAFGELLPTLQLMKSKLNTKCVLGIRDILDSPETVRAEWEASNGHEATAEFFDEIWVYGDARVYNPALEYDWPKANANKIRYTGYLNQTCRLSRSVNTRNESLEGLRKNGEQLIVCTLGGGQDGFPLAKAFVDCLPNSGVEGVLLTGPFLPPEHFRSLKETAERRDNLRVIEFSAEADRLVSQADRVITMGGYNTVCSLLSFQKSALLVPRIYPRSEQWIRAQRMQKLGFVDVMHPDEVSPVTLHKWLISEASGPPKAPDAIDLNGLKRIKELCRALTKKDVVNRASPPRELA